jgi:hypothetical protein
MYIMSPAESGRIERPDGDEMRFTLYTDFALRTLIQVGLNDGKLTTINDIARSFGISKQHLMKVVNDLGEKGLLTSVQGQLRKSPFSALCQLPPAADITMQMRTAAWCLSRHMRCKQTLIQ